ncbi:HNH endonuclease signature motif containing protein [Actinomycetospora sp. C-140]
MSERVGAAEREMLARARARMVARNVEHYRLLEDVAELDRRGVAELTGDRWVDRLVAELGRYDRAEATRLVAESRDLVPQRALSGEPLAARYPGTADALATGAISSAHVAVIRRTMARIEKLEHLAPAVVAEAESRLAEDARELGPRGLEKAAARLLAHLDPDGAAPEPAGDGPDEVRVLRRRDGTLDLRGSIRDTAAAALIDEGFDVMSAPAGPDDHRGLAARQADTLIELFAGAAGSGGLITDTRREGEAEVDAEVGAGPAEDAAQGALIPGPRLPEPTETSAPASAGRALLTITIDHRWLRRATGHGTLDGEALADVHTVRRWACDAEIIPMVLGTRSEPLDVGRRSRAVTDAMRRALNLRDGGCAFPGCTRRPRRCHAHHLDHWVDGGETCLENLCLLCLYHHQLVHHSDWTIAMVGGRPWFTPPSWVDPDRRPRPGGRHPVSL